MPAEDLEQIVDSAISAVPHDIAEDFMKALGSLGKAVGPSLQRAAPGIAQGATTGASVGGPWGALIGAGAGLASSSLSTGKPAPPAATTPAVSLPPSATSTPEAPAAPALPTGQKAAATLVSLLLKNPTVGAGLASQVLGADGSQQVPSASGTNLPRLAINSLLMQLLANASQGLPESESISEQNYLQGESGEYLIDPASPEQQAALVLSHLQSAGAARLQSDAGEFMETAEWTLEELDDSEAEWLESEESTEWVRFY
jgi:hypothetical protein